MVLSWVNERNLKDFFDILAARNKADEGRLAFWSNYMKQITWTRLVFGADTMALKSKNPEIRDLIAREEGAYAELTANRDVDAFMMRIGQYIIVEFSKKPNAAYVYRADALKFDLYQKRFSGGTDDLKFGYYENDVLRIRHPPGWQDDAGHQLRRLGIDPDRAGAKMVHSADAWQARRFESGGVPPSGARATTAAAQPFSAAGKSLPGGSFDIADLQRLVKRFNGALIQDNRGNGGGRLWVEDPNQNASLASELKACGFKWASSRMAWYYPES
jgi:hypothetical protein